MVSEGQLLWSPDEALIEKANVTRYMRWLEATRQLSFSDYDALWRWSVDDIDAFWASIWDYFDVQSEAPYEAVLGERTMPGAQWFPGSRVNYAEHLLRHERADPDAPAFYHATELTPLAVMSRGELGRRVRIVATHLRKLGVKPGDRVVSYMPNIPATAIAMIATVAIGAVWSAAAIEFGAPTVVDRFGQIEPKILFAAAGYHFGGKSYSRHEEAAEIVASLPSLEHVIWYDGASGDVALPDLPGMLRWDDLFEDCEVDPGSFTYERVAHDHPLWILYSSGTTGLPKAIVHSHVGVLVEHLKLTAFHLNLKPGSRILFYSTTGWMMWNLLVGCLLSGASAVLYDGRPDYPEPDLLWKLAAEAKVTLFGGSPTYVQLMEKKGIHPSALHDLSELEMVMLAGAPATPESFDWLYKEVKQDLWVTSQSGGTEFCSAFVGAVPTSPVRAGEIQTRLLGMDVHAWNDDCQSVRDQVGELVLTSPAPSMPIGFWGDIGAERYREAYFSTFPGVWRHGDFLRITSGGGCYITGRSDSTLNRFGVRIGTAEIYRVAEQLDFIEDSLIVCCEMPGGGFFMPLFVQLKPGLELNDEMRDALNARLRLDCSPRHVPDVIHQVPAVPYTLTGKKMEVPVRKILMGAPVSKAASADATKNPESLDWYAQFARQMNQKQDG
ncbi:MAG: acetoacetate--CoA ligase [Pontixanthobacter sp.]